MTGTNRRTFLKASLAGASGLVLGTSARPVMGAADRINVALVGCGGRGRYVALGMAEQGARISVLCDLLESRMGSTAEFLKKAQPEPPRLDKDLDAVLAAKDVDAVIVATPDHWHAPATVAACRAGKDVYVEKPHSHNLWESARMIEAARRHKRIVQVGTQNRSGPYNLQALEVIRSGRMGKIGLVKVFNLKSGGPFRLGEAGSPPAGFDWDRWLGRAPARPYHQGIVNQGWLWMWDFAGGDMSADAIHQIDLALMMMGDPGPARSVRAVGGRYVNRGDDAETPDVQLVSWEFPDFLMEFNMTNYPRYMEKTSATIRRNDEHPYWTQNATRIEFYGSELMMILGRHGGGVVTMQSGGRVVDKVYGRPCDEPHYANFLECVRSRKTPNADIAVADAGNVLVHMGNIATRLGGASLRYDAAARTFDNADANRLIKPAYRAGYEIPDEA